MKRKILKTIVLTAIISVAAGNAAADDSKRNLFTPTRDGALTRPLARAAGQSEAETRTTLQQITPAGTQVSAAGPAQNFTGRVRVDPLFPASDDIQASGAYVTFEPGARSAWHAHPAGQRLVVVSGIGLVQQWGKPVQEIRPGDVIACPPGVKHWHGAASTTAMTHLAVTGSAGGQSVNWMEKVSDDQYNTR